MTIFQVQWKPGRQTPSEKYTSNTYIHQRYIHHHTYIHTSAIHTSEKYTKKKQLHCMSLERVGFPGGSKVKNLPAISGATGDPGSTPEWGRSSGGGNGNPLHYSSWDTPMDREAWQATVYGVPDSQTQLKQLGSFLEREEMDPPPATPEVQGHLKA